MLFFVIQMEDGQQYPYIKEKMLGKGCSEKYSKTPTSVLMILKD